MTEYSYKLMWADMEDSERERVCFKYCRNEFKLFINADIKLIDYDEYCVLVREGKIAPPKSYWKVPKNKLGLICEMYFAKHHNTWEKVNAARRDFNQGWIACEKQKRN